MADAGSSIFNKQATERLRSPDDLDRYVRATTPSSWVILTAILMLLAGLLAWGVFGSVTTSIPTTAAYVDGRVICMLDSDSASKVSVGDTAYVDGTQATIASISAVPLSLEEARAILVGDYLTATLMPADWAYLVTLEGVTPEEEGVPLEASIIADRRAPISLVLE